MTVTITQETITPVDAAKYLAANSHNRGLVENRVATIKQDILDNNYVLNGETIKFSDSDVLLDGQHRLQAVIEADKPIVTLVVRGLEATSQDTIDVGAKRTFSDILKLAGEHNTATLAACTRISWFIDTFGEPKTGPGQYPSVRQLTAYLGANPDLRKSGLVGQQAARSTLRIPSSIGGGLHYQMFRLDPTRADDFWNLLLLNDAPKGSPIYALRETLLKDLGKPHRMSPTHRAALIVKAWNFWVTGKTGMTHIMWRPSGSVSETFPKLINPND